MIKNNSNNRNKTANYKILKTVFTGYKVIKEWAPWINIIIIIMKENYELRRYKFCF